MGVDSMDSILLLHDMMFCLWECAGPRGKHTVSEDSSLGGACNNAGQLSLIEFTVTKFLSCYGTSKYFFDIFVC